MGIDDVVSSQGMLDYLHWGSCGLEKDVISGGNKKQVSSTDVTLLKSLSSYQAAPSF